jgi:hypothetical protein
MPRRIFSRAFKRALVRRVTTGATRPVQLCHDYHISPGTLSRWRAAYALRGEAALISHAPASVATLERRSLPWSVGAGNSHGRIRCYKTPCPLVGRRAACPTNFPSCSCSSVYVGIPPRCLLIATS